MERGETRFEGHGATEGELKSSNREEVGAGGLRSVCDVENLSEIARQVKRWGGVKMKMGQRKRRRKLKNSRDTEAEKRGERGEWI